MNAHEKRIAMKNAHRFGSVAALAAIALCACKPQAQPAATPPAEPPASALARARSGVAPGDTMAASDEATPTAAEAVVRAYYAAIDARDFATAYAQWSDGGKASGQSFERFRDGYANTESVRTEVGTATDEEGAAGSRYIRVPMELHARQRDGGTRHYRGSFILRAAVADGASAEQRRWHLYSADIQRLPD